MSRVPPLLPEEQSDEQRRIAAAIAGSRGGAVGGPFAIWLRTPDIAERADLLGERLRMKSRLEPAIFELAILVVAREFSAQYEWFAHAGAATAVGVPPDVIEAIRLRRTPEFARQEERVAFDTACELARTKRLNEPAYERALETFGLDLLIELITVIGFYSMIAMLLNAFDAPVPGGAFPLPV
jgi:4-carboxymuconolactone decarboxylase